MHLPDFLETFRKAAVKLLPSVEHVEFSGETYQVQIADPKLENDAWALIQLDGSGAFKDGFCSSEECEDVSRCRHLAAAYLRIFNNTPYPLHQRFSKSLWNQLCLLYCDHFGYETEVLDDMKGVFSIEGLNAEGKGRLNEIIHHRLDETEETSLKFSNLSQEELQYWREGRPTLKLKYELSFWSDIAKWLMELQDKQGNEKITFSTDKEGVPTAIHIAFPEVKVSFSKLTREQLAELIPSLATVSSPLPVHDFEESAIESIHYDENEHVLKVTTHEHVAAEEGGIHLGAWLFVPGEGFFAKGAHGLLSEGELQGEALIEALDNYTDLLKAKGIQIHAEPIPVSYTVDFDDRWNLHVAGYLVKPGDLTHATRFGNWVYAKGFHRTEGFRFDEISFLVSPSSVGDFVTENRFWFENFPGFKTHLANLEGQLIYSVSENNYLSFTGNFQGFTETTRSRDFGSWIYVEDQGFYSKVGTVSEMPLRPGMALNREQIPPFIRMNREELKYVPGFFSESCPIEEAGLIVALTDDERIWIHPRFEKAEEYQKKHVRFFEDFTYVDGEGFYQLPAGKQLPSEFQESTYLDDSEISVFLSQEIPELKQRYSITLDPRLYLPQEITLMLTGVSPKEHGLYGLKLSYETGQGAVSVCEIWTAMHEKKRFLFHEFGLIDLHHRRYDWIRKVPKKRIDRRGNTVTLSTLEVIKLHIYDAIHVNGSRRKEDIEARQFIERLTTFSVPEAPDITGLVSQLRPYQEVGLKWLWFLYNQRLSGLLCDDMGLGKTHQAMALIAAIYNQQKSGPFLVICPTSVIYHWEDKLKVHLPHLKVCTFYGAKRTLDEEYDILLTSYGVWRIDYEKLHEIPFQLAILDEVQMAKNASSRLFASVQALDAQMRLGLTGTPIENDLFELKNLFDIVLPDFMPGTTQFKEEFVKPIERDRNSDRKKLLNRFIHPFLLRRKKEEVLTDLPEKTEEVYHCGLTTEQAYLYRDVLEGSRRQLLSELADGRAPIPYIHIFAILSSLKQICDHPAVYLKCPESYKEHRSGKWDLFLELLSEARESRQKVVVYSQYLNMLDIIEEYLNESGIGYATIRGATTKRGEQLKKFNTDPNCEVFVGSLQASGLGIDLTAASVVIHYDRWWNAARENQATDRVHRIGQQRGVQVFKLVTKGTFEERIDELIRSKGKLMEDVVGSDDQHLIKYLNREEILELLKFTGLDDPRPE